MRMILGIACLIPLNAFAKVPTLKAVMETAPIPAGFSDSDDTAIWAHPHDPERSLILGTSKYDEDGQGGLGVYALDGRELQFLAGSKLNSVDVWGDLAVATNRSANALDFFRIEDGTVHFVARAPLLDAQGQPFEPYGLCLAEDSRERLHVYLPTKTGVVYDYIWNQVHGVQLLQTHDLGAAVTSAQDEWVKSIVTKETIAEGEEDELEDNLAERFILEGCAYDGRTQKLYVGMENLGIWRLDTGPTKARPELIIPIQGSWTDIEQWQDKDRPRVTDDIEGLDVFYHDGHPYLIFSSQGISEFTLYDLENVTWLGNFKIRLNKADSVTLTDGLSIKTGHLGPRYPEGILVVHDDENTDAAGTLQNANYKAVSLQDLFELFEDAMD